MIAETMAGIALVKGAVDGIKSIINTANDVSDIAGYVDKLFEGEKQVQQKRNKKSGIDNFGGIGGVASEVIDARLAKEKMQEMATLIDMRFGHGTWKSIVDERARRLQEEKAKAMEARRIQIQKDKEMEELFQNILLVIAIVVVLVIAVVVAVNII
tara:strand:- start:2167 stop:2634 length:468 start_codon:yes stop_codon:yes gene_type:complete